MFKSKLDTVSTLLVDILEIVLGILFLYGNTISWIILYILVVIFCLSDPVLWTISLCLDYKQQDSTDLPLIFANFLFGTFLLVRPSFFLKYMYILLGAWMLCRSLMFFLDFYALRKDARPGAHLRILQGIFACLLGIALFHGNFPLLTLFLGLFFILEGTRKALESIRVHYPSSFLARHSSYAFSMPLLLSAFYPIRTYVSMRAFRTKQSSKEDQTPDVWVHIYMKGNGFETLGHVDISYKGKIYSYGCHDPKCRILGGCLGDGVLIEADEEAFLKQSSEGDHKSIISFGLRLTQVEKQQLEKNIHDLEKRTVPWHCQYEEDGKAQDYASRLYKKTHCRFYKFKDGKFKTYFVMTTNCVLLADSLVRTKDLQLLTLTGIITPGNYLSFLNTAYAQSNTKVVARKICIHD